MNSFDHEDLENTRFADSVRDDLDRAADGIVPTDDIFAYLDSLGEPEPFATTVIGSQAPKTESNRSSDRSRYLTAVAAALLVSVSIVAVMSRVDESESISAPATSVVTAENETNVAGQPEPITENNGKLFSDDFSDPSWEQRYEFVITHKNNRSPTTEWLGDNAKVSSGLEDNCSEARYKAELDGAATTDFYRTIQVDSTTDWIYRCVPSNELANAHLLTSVGDISGFSRGAFAIRQEFSDVKEIRWDTNLNDLGKTQWTEVSIIPADNFDLDDLPCIPGSGSCGDTTHATLGGIGTSFSGGPAREIATAQMPGGYVEALTETGYRCETCTYGPSRKLFEKDGYNDTDARLDLNTRRSNFLRDNGDETVTWGLEICDGDECAFDEFTVPGAFPTGSVRVVLSHQNINSDNENHHPTASPVDPATNKPQKTNTWHWDNIEVLGANKD